MTAEGNWSFMVTLRPSDFNSQAYSFDNMNQPMKTFLSLKSTNPKPRLSHCLKNTTKSFKLANEHKNMTNRFSRSRLGETIVSIVLKVHKREDNEIPPHFFHEIKTKRYDVIDVKIFPLNKDSSLKRLIRSLLYYLPRKYPIYTKKIQQINWKESWYKYAKTNECYVSVVKIIFFLDKMFTICIFAVISNFF